MPDDKILLIGPYTITDFSSNDFMAISEKLKIPAENTKRLEHFYSTVPIITDESFIFSIITSFAELVFENGHDLKLTDVSENIFAFNEIPLKETEDFSSEPFLNMEMMEKRYRYENEIMYAVQKGQIQKAELILSGFNSLSFENRVTDPLRNMKNYSIIINTLFRKAAENGGVHPIYINSLSSDFAKKIELLQSVRDVPKFMIDMFKAYCNLVNKHSVKDFSPLIQKAIIYIDTELTENLTLHSIAKKCNVSDGHLSTRFHKETGKTITDFINLSKIEHAKKLLKSTNLQIQTISQHCGILDIHYFTKLFKKYEGISPKQYREK
jgi:YesN/AraC family two-component response regulator